MKRLSLVISILAFCVLLGTLGLKYSENFCGEITELASHAADACPEENILALDRYTKRISDAFYNSKSILSLYVRHDDIERVEEAISELKGNAAAEDYAAATASLSRLGYFAEHIYRREQISFDNIL